MFGFDDVISGVGSIAGAIGGQIQQAQAYSAQQQALQDILNRYQRINLPELQNLNPVLLGASEQGQVTTDPALQAQQMQTLHGLQQESDTAGQTPADQAALNLSLNEAGRREAAQKQAMQNLLAARSLGSSGASVGLQLGGLRDSGQASADAAVKAQIAARGRALDALKSGGQMAGQVRGQQFQERSTAAQARDAWSRYNAGAMDSANRYNAGLPEQRFQNQRQMASDVSQAQQNLASSHFNQGQQAAGFAGTLGSSLGQMGASLYNDAKPPRTSYDFSPDAQDAAARRAINGVY
jgi:hypothetical protein